MDLLNQNITAIKLIKKSIDNSGYSVIGYKFPSIIAYMVVDYSEYKKPVVIQPYIAQWKTAVVQENKSSFYIGLDLGKSIGFNITANKKDFYDFMPEADLFKLLREPADLDIDGILSKDAIIDRELKKLNDFIDRNVSYAMSVEDSKVFGISTSSRNKVERSKYLPLFKYFFTGQKAINSVGKYLAVPKGAIKVSYDNVSLEDVLLDKGIYYNNPASLQVAIKHVVSYGFLPKYLTISNDMLKNKSTWHSLKGY